MFIQRIHTEKRRENKREMRSFVMKRTVETGGVLLGQAGHQETQE